MEEYDNGSTMKLIKALEKERQRIAGEIHDTTVQNLTGLVHKSEFCMKVMDQDPIRAKLELETMTFMLRDVIGDLRNIIYNLRPMSIDDLNLTVTVERMLRKMKQEHDGISIHSQIRGEEPTLSQTVRITVFRIIQEAINNVYKHAQATTISIKLFFDKNSMDIEIEDDGIGFNYEDIIKKVEEGGSNYGLEIMRERIEVLNGKLEIKKGTSSGSLMKVVIPY